MSSDKHENLPKMLTYLRLFHRERMIISFTKSHIKQLWCDKLEFVNPLGPSYGYFYNIYWVTFDSAIGTASDRRLNKP